jgi:hypothetical protein
MSYLQIMIMRTNRGTPTRNLAGTEGGVSDVNRLAFVPKNRDLSDSMYDSWGEETI